MPSEIPDEIRYRLLKRIEEQPDLSQRQLARELGVSVGKVNYCVAALVEKGWVKIHNFRHNERKLGYAYLLTPQGMSEKTRITVHFLRRKIAEYDAIEREIEQLRREVAALNLPEEGSGL